MKAPLGTNVSVDGTNVIIRLSWRDKAAAVVGNQIVPLAAISAATVVTEPLGSISGTRCPGLAIPWATKVGVWRRRGHRTLVVVHRHQRAVRLEAVGQRFDSYLIGADEPAALVATIEAVGDRG